MTPEQENELVAKWMGWVFFDEGLTGISPYWRYGDINASMDPPPYREDPALLWELMERLILAHWVFDAASKGRFCADPVGPREPITRDTLAEAVFAAAVMQAEQEGK